MKKQLIQEWIWACDVVIHRYENNTYDYLGCPLCTVARRDSRRQCKDCLWVKFEGVACTDDDAKWGCGNKGKIRRINRWKRKLNKILKDGGKTKDET